MDSAEFEIEESSEIDESSSDFGSLGALAPAWREGDAISEEEALEMFYEWLAEHEIDLWPHQDEALMSLMVGDHVILGTPTGSGKSMVAIGMMFMALCSGKRAFYTAPIKALVSEKFFGLVNMLGRGNVGRACAREIPRSTHRLLLSVVPLRSWQTRRFAKANGRMSVAWQWTNSISTATPTAVGLGRFHCLRFPIRSSFL